LVGPETTTSTWSFPLQALLLFGFVPVASSAIRTVPWPVKVTVKVLADPLDGVTVPGVVP
jgi:hypothetical protein